MNKRRFEIIKKATIKKPYIFYFILMFLIYIAINIFVNKLYISLSVLKGFALWFLISFLFFNFLLVPFLVALTINLSILRLKEAGLLFGKEGGAIGMGVFSGILGGACPGCFVGLFPAVLGIFGITATLSFLPFYGLEIQLLSVILLLVAANFLTKDIVCKVPLEKSKK